MGADEKRQLRAWYAGGFVELYSVQLRVKPEYMSALEDGEDGITHTVIATQPLTRFTNPDVFWKVKDRIEAKHLETMDVITFTHLGRITERMINGPDPRTDRLGDTPDQDGD